MRNLRIEKGWNFVYLCEGHHSLLDAIDYLKSLIQGVDRPQHSLEICLPDGASNSMDVSPCDSAPTHEAFMK